MLKRRSSVSNCCIIESSNRLNSIFIKFNFFIFKKYFCKGGPGPPPRSATALGASGEGVYVKGGQIRAHPAIRHLPVVTRITRPFIKISQSYSFAVWLAGHGVFLECPSISVSA